MNINDIETTGYYYISGEPVMDGIPNSSNVVQIVVQTIAGKRIVHQQYIDDDGERRFIKIAGSEMTPELYYHCSKMGYVRVRTFFFDGVRINFNNWFERRLEKTE